MNKAWTHQLQPVARYFVTVEYSIDPDSKQGRLSIVSVDHPKRNGDCLGGCGQNREPLTDPSRQTCRSWSRADRERLAEVWAEWHLNDMQAGCSHQRANGWNIHDVGRACPECGYRYGSAWLYRPIPDDILRWLYQLPTSGGNPWEPDMDPDGRKNE